MKSIQQRIDEYHEQLAQIDGHLEAAENELKGITEETSVFEVSRSLIRTIRRVAAGTKLLYVVYNCSHDLPGLSVMHLYQGQVVGLDDRLKIGITTDLKTRNKSINRSLTFLGFDATFEIFDSVAGRPEFVKAVEASALEELADYRIKGEWFRPEEAVGRWFIEATMSVSLDLEASVEALDVDAQIEAALKPPTFPFLNELEVMVNKEAADPALRVMRGLKRLFDEWSKAFEIACERKNRFIAMKASVDTPDTAGRA